MEHNDPLPPDLIQPKTAARLIGTHVATIYRWIHSGQIRAWKRGHRYMVSRGEAMALVQPVRPTR